MRVAYQLTAHRTPAETDRKGYPMDLKKPSKIRAFTQGTNGLVIIILVAIVAFVIFTAVLTSTLTESVLDNALEENRARTDAMYQIMDDMLSKEDFANVNSSADKDTAEYQRLQTHMNEIRSMNSTRYFYTAKMADDGTLVYVVDGLDQGTDDFRNPGDAIEDEMIPYISRALSGEAAYANGVVDTSWGHIFTACYPVHDSQTGDVVGAICIETDMESTYQYISNRRGTLISIAVVAAAIAIVLIVCIFLFVRHFRNKEELDQQRLINSYEKLEEALAREKKHSEIIAAIATIYTTVFIVNIKTHEYEVIDSVDLMHGVAGAGGKNIKDTIGGILETFVEVDMRTEMWAFLDVDTLDARLGSDNTVMTEYRNPEGRWFQARFIVKKRDAAGHVEEVLYVARDFTDEKERELDLLDQLADKALEAKRANISKTSFLRRMSHDIRTPLNGIIGMLHVSERYEGDAEKQCECREKMLHSADYLLDLVNNVLDISKLESGALELENKPFNMAELLLKTLPIVEANASEHGIRFEGGREASKLIHLNLIGSPLHVNRVLMNIASNAVKYNKPNGVLYLSCNEIASDADTATYRFICRDTGLGMSEEFQKRAFEPFTQEGKETTTSFTGSGLGLSIVKDIVEMMGGTITLESEENVGTTFTIDIPFALDKNAQVSAGGQALAPAPANVNLAGKHALLVEDNDLNREIAQIILADEGLIISSACNGQEAVDAFAASAPGEFDFVFMDVMMPVMDGLEATRAIRSLDRSDAKTVRIIAMTANAFNEDKQACLAAGMDAHVGKPIDVDVLHETIASLEAIHG